VYLVDVLFENVQLVTIIDVSWLAKFASDPQESELQQYLLGG
jgi:hypothetical protein